MEVVLEMNQNLQVELVNLDSLYLFGSDSPNMVIGNIIFNGSKYLAWSMSIKIGFRAKLKLGFIDGSIKRPIPI